MRTGFRPRISRAAARGAVVGLAYLVVSGLWIASSDRYVEMLSGSADPAVLTRYQTLKGWGFVLVTACLLGVVVWRMLASLERANQGLRAVEKRYQDLIELSPSGVLVHAEWKLVFANAAAARMFGAASPEALLGRDVFGLVHPDSRVLVRGRAQRYIAHGLAAPEGEQKLLRVDGSVFEGAVTSAPIQYEGRPAVLAIVNDITARKAAEERYRFVETHDPRTGLPNRATLRELLEERIGRSEHAAHLLLAINVDRLSAVNDTLGFHAGDQLLHQIAGALRGAVRGEDVVARVSGGEFMALLADLRDAGDAPRLAKKIVDAISRPYVVEGSSLTPTFSCGYATFPEAGRDADTLMQNVHATLFHVRGGGKGGIAAYSEGIRGDLEARIALEGGLRAALTRDEFVVHYQPIVGVRERRIVACEALVRWQRPDGGVVPPGRFIPLAEDSGLIVPLGAQVMRKACRQLADWSRGDAAPVNVSINLSPRQLHDPDLVATLQAALAGSALPAHQVELELTEGMLVVGGADVEAILARLKDIGVRLTLDDFGTGYSSLAYLRRFRIDCLKIDQSFVRGVADHPADETIARTIVSLARSLNMKTVGEGVETPEQAARLAAMGCDYLQGYLFGRPMFAGDFEAWRAKPLDFAPLDAKRQETGAKSG
jgi:diguanylate cyclase (GGDEF)-like protein/PAS domain S-box-containing protein